MAMSSLAAKQIAPLESRVLRITHMVLSLGLNVAIGKIRHSRYARYVMALLILNEIRGLYIVYITADNALLPWLS